MEYLNTIFKVSVHFKYGLYKIFTDEMAASLIPYNCHSQPYCLKIKSECHEKCMLEQQKIIDKCSDNKSFFNVCHAGVREYIFSLKKNNESIGFIAVGEYDDVALVDTLVFPLVIMTEKLLSELPPKSEDDFLAIKGFLNEYHTNVSLDILSKTFNRSKSYISHTFKAKSGMSIRGYCNNLKLEDALKSVLNTNLSITEIAMNTGFNDVSHFISSFKEKYGKTPLQLRKNKADM